jgi:hypothetical protein
MECQSTWAAVLANPNCSGTPPGPISEEHHSTCGPYEIRSIHHSDFGAVYYYDATTGALVAIYRSAVVGLTCSAGPPSGVRADCAPGAETDAQSPDTDICLLPDRGSRG